MICDREHIDFGHFQNSSVHFWYCWETSWGRGASWVLAVLQTIPYLLRIPKPWSYGWSKDQPARLLDPCLFLRSGKAWSVGWASHSQLSSFLAVPVNFVADRLIVLDWFVKDELLDQLALSWDSAGRLTAPIVYFFRIANQTIAISPFDSLLNYCQQNTTHMLYICYQYIIWLSIHYHAYKFLPYLGRIIYE